jgi:GNAT superfamily N-acetyltransferase
MTAWLDRITYRVKLLLPGAYCVLAWGNALGTRLLYGRRIRVTLVGARVEGFVGGDPAVVRPLGPADVEALHDMIVAIPEDHLRFFHPHGLDRDALHRVLKSRTILAFGMFVRQRLVGYALLKLFANRTAYAGRLIHPEFAGAGLGRYLIHYLYHIGFRLGFRIRATISRENVACLRSHAAVRPLRILAGLPNNFQLVEYHQLPSDADLPVLAIASAECH